MPKLMLLTVNVILTSFLFATVLTQIKNYKLLKCLVCQKIIEEVSAQVSQAEIENKTIAVGSYHLNDEGSTNQQFVSYAHSDIFLNEVMDNLCESMKDYIRARRKSDKKLTILPLVLPGGKMNPELSKVDPILDRDLNNSLGYYCQQIVSEYEEEIIEKIKQGNSNSEDDFCSSVAPYCSGEIEEEEEDLKDIFPLPSVEEIMDTPLENKDEL